MSRGREQSGIGRGSSGVGHFEGIRLSANLTLERLFACLPVSASSFILTTWLFTFRWFVCLFVCLFVCVCFHLFAS